MGIRRPHLTWRVPKPYADLYPAAGVALPVQAGRRVVLEVVLEGWYLRRRVVLEVAYQGWRCLCRRVEGWY